jgi:hypothetical protein
MQETFIVFQDPPTVSGNGSRYIGFKVLQIPERDLLEDVVEAVEGRRFP